MKLAALCGPSTVEYLPDTGYYSVSRKQLDFSYVFSTFYRRKLRHGDTVILRGYSDALVPSRVVARSFKPQGIKFLVPVYSENWIDYKKQILDALLVAQGVSLTKSNGVDRAALVLSLTQEGFFRDNPEFEIHLAGESLLFKESIKLKNHPNVVGVSSLLPVVLALNGIAWDFRYPTKTSTKDLYHTDNIAPFKHADLIYDNVKAASKLVAKDALS